MADTALTMSPGGQVHYRQVISPEALSGGFVADDTDNHIAKVDGRGKGRFTVAGDNPANQTVTITVYGMHSATGAVADAGTFQIFSFTITATADKGYEVCNDPFPFYLVNVAYGVVPTDNPLTTCSLYIDFSSA